MRKKQEETSFVKKYEGMKDSHNSVVDKINKIMNSAVSDNPFIESVNKSSITTENTDQNYEKSNGAKESKMSTILLDDE